MTEAKTIAVEANGIRFTALEQGSGPLLLCMHGFPDNALTFRHQMPVLAAAGYRVVAPYQRGYAPTSASPTGTYQSAALGRDIIALIDELSPGEPAVVFGHDWGAIASYAAALHAPHRISKLITAGVPYGPAVNAAFLTSYAQQKRSWYIFFFQNLMAEMAVAHDDLRFIRNLWRDWSPTWDFTEADIGPVLETLAAPGVLAEAIAYYRCLFDPARMDPELMAEQMRYSTAPVEVPTLYFHGTVCGCMGVELTDGMEESFPKGLEKVLVEDAGHFVHHEKPAEVNARILAYLGK
ncbi:MAG: alpha/beta fold hydrolase [Candidatus Binatia bacterium]